VNAPAKPAPKPKPAAAAKPPAKPAKPAAKPKPKPKPKKQPDSQFELAGASAATFIFEVDGVAIGRFSEVSGLQVDVEIEEYVEGGESGFVHKLPGRLTWPNLVLKRGVTNDDNLLAWLQKSVGDGMVTRKGKAERTTAALFLVGLNGKRLRIWSFVDALPVRWTGPSFAATSSDLAEEELEIAHHGFRAKTL
jgi:phage tail-like protein